MSTFHFDEGALQIPEHWTDRSVNILINSAEGTPSFNLVITREPLVGRDFAEVMAAQLKDVSKQLAEYQLLGTRETLVAGLPAIEARSVFATRTGRMYHHVTAVAYYDRALMLTATTNFKDAEGCDLAVAGLLESLTLREREE
jgi:hypothetical protein